MCEHIVMIHQGRKVLDDTLAGIRAGHRPNAMRLEPLDPATGVPDAVRALPAVEGVEPCEGGYRLALAEGADLSATFAALAAAWPPAKLEVVRPSLEDIFIDIVGSSLEQEQAA
jgi:ABC-2 type transport system ATP-binding protein